MTHFPPQSLFSPKPQIVAKSPDQAKLHERHTADFRKIPQNRGLVAQSWFLYFWRSDECPKGITMISEVQEFWERISFFKVQGEEHLIFKKFQKIEK